MDQVLALHTWAEAEVVKASDKQDDEEKE